MTKITFKALQNLNPKESKLLKAKIMKGECSIAITKEGFVLTIDQKISNKNVAKNNEPLYESELIDFATKKDVPLTKRKYTKRENWNNPDVSAKHDENQTDAHFQARIDRETDSLVKEFLKSSGMTKKEFTSRAFREFLSKESDDADELNL